MSDQEFVLCKWKRRLWPAKVLCKPGAAGNIPVGTTKKMGLKAEILGLEKQVSVSSANAVPLTEERIKAIASNLEQKNNVSEAVEELQYRCALKMALDVLSQSEPGPRGAQSSRDSRVGCAPPAPSWRSRSTEPEAAGRKRKPQSNWNLKGGTKTRSQGGPVPSEPRGRAQGGGTSPAKAAGSGTNLSKACGDGTSPAKAPGSGANLPKGRGGGTNPPRCGPRDSWEAPSPASPSCKTPEPKASPRQRKAQPRAGHRAAPKPREGRNQPGRKRPRRDDSPRDQAQLPVEGSLPVPSKSGTMEPAPRPGSRRGRTFLESSGASDEPEKSVSGGRESPAKQLDRRRKAEGGKQLDGAGVAPGRGRKGRKHSGSSPGALPQPQEQENKDPSRGNTAKLIQLPDSEEDEGLEAPGMSSRRISLECSPPLSPLVDEEEEYFPSVLKFAFFSPAEPQAMEEGMLVWCKLRRYPYWPAVVKTVKRKHRRACVLFIDGTTNEKKRGFSVSLKSLKHFDCEEKQELITRARENYAQEIEWCIQLILDYRIRVGCHSFTGSFLEYFAADISYPVRKQGFQSEVQMTFPSPAEEDLGESSLENSPQKPLRKLLPDRSRAARDRENKKLVEFIVKTKGAEEHLLGILKSGKQSRWLQKFLSSHRYMTCVETYLEDEEQLDLVVDYLKEVYREMDTTNLHQILGDGIKFISDVLLPEAIIYAIAAVDDIDYKKAEEKYIKGPPVSKR
ncbi:MUM1 protein, partial [Calyptomena viridis]|nr:MUM1 protein [Calyptomena viridis]